jgi:hypothetical protein
VNALRVLAGLACLAGCAAGAQSWRETPEPESGGLPQAEFHMARLA